VTFAILLLIGFIVLALGIAVLVLPKMPNQKNESLKPRATNLSGEQKAIYEIIADSGGSCLQGEIVDKSKMSKVTVSRILDKLEMRGLVERRRHGMSNIVVLKKR
jgi:uncharacterized membrane protein